MPEKSGTPSIIIVGSINMDRTLYVEAFPVPGETVISSAFRRSLGGKGANQAIAASRFATVVRFVGAVGDDADGRAAVLELLNHGIDVGNVVAIPEVPTGSAYITVVPSGENSIVVHSGVSASVLPGQVAWSVRSLIGPGDIVVAQGELPPKSVDAAAAACAESGGRFILNLAPVIAVEDASIALADPLVVNEGELIAVTTKFQNTTATSDIRHLAVAVSAHVRSLIVTRGAEGALVIDNGAVVNVPAPSNVRVVDTTGAGDAFVGALAGALAQGARLQQAAATGVAYATLAVTRHGASSSYVSAEEFHRGMTIQPEGGSHG